VLKFDCQDGVFDDFTATPLIVEILELYWLNIKLSISGTNVGFCNFNILIIISIGCDSIPKPEIP
jgi:hypothetical protein